MPADRSTVFFDKISGAYDREFSEGFSGSEQRKSIHRYLTKYVLQKKLISAHPSILELNGGTGTDALFLHSLGCHVSYSDGSREMVTVAAQKFSNHNVFIDASVINLNNPSEHQKKYDLIFSNFSGLNCVSADQLTILFKWIDQILTPEGDFIAVVFGTNPLIERLFFALKGNKKGFFRRRKVYQEAGSSRDDSFPVYYFSPGDMKRICPKEFYVFHIQPVGFFIPPGFLSSRIEKYKSICKWIARAEEWVSQYAFLANASDHYLIHFKKRS